MSIFRKRIWKDRIDTVRLYYKSPKFALIDLTFGLLGLFSNPYQTCRKFLEKRREVNIHAYGETPYTSYAKIAQECGVGPHDTWIELGSGRGKGCFWMAHFTGCKVIGVEWVGQFVFLANLIKRLFGVKGVQFKKEDIQRTDLSRATVIYLYGLWPEIEIPKGIKVITTGDPLDGLQVIKSFWIRFPWGRTRAFLQEK